MYKKNIKVGALVMALSFSAVNIAKPLYATDIYASEVSAPANENSNLETSKSLETLVNESENVKKSKRYNNASSGEKKAYDDAIANASIELKKENPENIEKLNMDIVDAIKGLGANAYVTSDARDGLSSTLAMANKLVADKSLDGTNKAKLEKAIKEAGELLKDVEKSADEIDQVNSNLSSLIDRIIVDKNLDASKYTLSEDELTNIESADLAAYGNARSNLSKLIDDANKFYNANKSGTSVLVKNLSDDIKKASNVFDDSNSETNDFKKAYENLYKALSDAQVAKDKNNTEENRLKTTLTNLTNEKFAGKDKAGRVSKSTYENAIANGKKVLENKDAKTEDYQKAIKIINRAKLALKPVETKTLTGGKKDSDKKNNNSKANNSENIEKEAKDLLDKLSQYTSNKDKVVKSKFYSEADKTLQTAYDNAIDKAIGLQSKFAKDKKSVTLDELKVALDKVEKALKDIGYEDKETSSSDLKVLIDEAKAFRQNEKFSEKVNSKNAYDNSLTKDYNSLIEEAEKYLTSSKDEKDNYIDRISDLKKAILDEISHDELDLRGQVRQAKSFIGSDKYKNAKLSSDKELKKLVDSYDELIQKTESLLSNPKKSDDAMAKLSEDLENTKIAIENPNYKNLAVRKINEYVDLINEVHNHPKYKGIGQTNKDRLDRAVKAVEDTDLTKEDISKKKLDSLISDLEAGLNASDVKPIVEEIKKSKASKLEDLDENTLVEVAKEVQNHPDFNKDVGQNQRDSLRRALEALENALESKNQDDIDEAKERLISTLKASEIKVITEKVLANRKTSAETNLESLQNLISMAEKVKAHKDYPSIKGDLKEELDNAITGAKSTMVTKDPIKVDQAINTLKEVLAKDEFKDILKDIRNSISDDYKTKINDLISGDTSLRNEIKYTKAQKSLKEAYIKALDNAKKTLDKSDASDTDIKEAYDKLFDARKALDGDQFEKRFEALAKKFKDESSKITDSKVKKSIAEKINALKDNDKTMDDLIAIENELSKALPKEGNVSAQTSKVGVKSPNVRATTKTVPVTTSKSVPSTVRPGSIVRTGIKSIMGYVVVLAIAILGYLFISKKDKKNKNNEKVADGKEKMTSEGDKNEQNK